MALNTKRYGVSHGALLRDTRPLSTRVAETLRDQAVIIAIFICAGIAMWDPLRAYADSIMLVMLLYFWWLTSQDKTLSFRMPIWSKYKDKKKSKPEGIMYLGNNKDTRQQLWFNKADVCTHTLYLGTTGSGKTEGLKGLAANALAWGSGFVYIDGKADTDLWSSLSYMVRRFGRDDDLFVINYMTGNSDTKAPSNTLNPFSSGSASYLTNMLVNLMPDASGDNVMWKERAVSMIGAVMPALTWRRDHQDAPMSVSTIRQYLLLHNIIKMSREETLPDHIRAGLRGYLDTLPGYVDAAYDDNGQAKPPGPDVPNVDTNTASTQHGYLSMQLTRSLQSLGDDYGYIFDSRAADVEMLDVVLNRRILVVLIPALEKSSDETANLGKIVAATIKGMMGGTLGATVEGESKTIIENKPTHSSTPFMTIFDEVGYYTTQGMAVMAAQARSLGFSLVFAAQDLPALEKRVKEEARSIAANCNIKIFGKLEDPTQTKEFFEKTVNTAFVTEVNSFNTELGTLSKNYYETGSASVTTRALATYEGVRGFGPGEAVVCFADQTIQAKVFYAKLDFAKAMRVTRYMMLAPPTENLLRHVKEISRLRDLMVKKGWTAEKADVKAAVPAELKGLARAYHQGSKFYRNPVDAAIMAVAGAYAAVVEVDIHAPPEEIVIDLGSPEEVAAAAVPAAPPQVPVQEIPEPVVEAAPVAEPPARKVAAGGSPFSGFVKQPDQQDHAAVAMPPVQVPLTMPGMPILPPLLPEQLPAAAAASANVISLDSQTANILKVAAKDARSRLVQSPQFASDERQAAE